MRGDVQIPPSIYQGSVTPDFYGYDNESFPDDGIGSARTFCRSEPRGWKPAHEVARL